MALLARWPLAGDLLAAVGPNQQTLTGAVTFGPHPPFSLAGQFDGTDSTESVSALTLPDTSPQSIAAWVKTTDTSGYIAGTRDGSAGGISMFISSAIPRFVIGATTVGTPPTTTINDDQWHHLTLTYSGGGSGASTLETYIDGVLDTTSINDTFTWTSGNNTFLGARGDGAGGATFFIDGELADIRVYDEVLTQAQINNIISSAGGRNMLGGVIGQGVI